MSRPSLSSGSKAGATGPLVHPSIIALMREAQPGEKAADIMRRKCRDMVRHARTHGWTGPPYEPRYLASLNKIRVVATDEEIGGEGCIFSVRGRTFIRYRAGQMVERERFTICHELAHTCFPDAFEIVRHLGSGLPDERAYQEFEILCDIGAGELLLPNEDFLADLKASHVCLVYMSNLGRRYFASLDATIKRMLDLTTHPCAAAFLTDQGFKDFPAVPGQLRIKFFWKSESFRAFLPPGTMLPAQSCALSAPAVASPVFPPSRETWWINGRPYSWYVQSVRLPKVPENMDYPKVVALLHTVRPETLKN